MEEYVQACQAEETVNQNKVWGQTQDKKGLTLVEMLIAMTVLLIVTLALMQTALVGIDSNMRNLLRDEAINIAEMRMSEARNTAFASLVSDTTPGDNLALTSCQSAPVNDAANYPKQFNRDFRNTTISYGTRMTIDNTMGTDNKGVTILVRWEYRNECFSHSISTVLRSR